ncbi:MAG: NAD(P)H-dependent oxidoreductase subunit E [Phycisphaerae bacterium]|nr:NAD(P)H-dependent oxidoreductase subunit E [Phycisphaerae bacterium]
MSEVKNCHCQGEMSEDDMLRQIDGVLEDYKGGDGALIPVLQIAQNMFGYLPDAVLRRIGEKLNKPHSEVAGVVSFYSFFSTQPRGKYVVRVCLGTACYVRGGKQVLDALKKELQVDVGQTTADRMFSLDVGRCFGACGLAPAIMVNDDVHQRVKPVKLTELLDVYRNKENECAKEVD